METDALRLYYSARAVEYERVYQRPERQADLRRLEQLISALFIDAVVLEAACGTGYWTRFLAAGARRIVATDISEDTLKIAKSKGLDPGRVAWVQADAYDLPTLPDPFDAGFAAFWWSHVPIQKRDRFLDGLARRLRPGSKVVMIDNRYVEGNSTPLAETDPDGNTFQLRRLDDGSEHRVLKNYPDAAQLREDLGRHGEVTGMLELQYYWMASFQTPKG